MAGPIEAIIALRERYESDAETFGIGAELSIPVLTRKQIFS